MSVRELFSDGLNIKKVLESRRGYIRVLTESGEEVERVGGTVAWRCNNPGNLKNGRFSKSYGSIGEDYIGHAVFPTLEQGRNAQYNLLFNENSRYFSLTLEKAINRYAPAGDANNEPDKYINYISRNANIDSNDILGELSEEQKNDMIKYMSIFEGYKEGRDNYIGDWYAKNKKSIRSRRSYATTS